jgi:proprotein convertase subtilisin/kexin type 5
MYQKGGLTVTCDCDYPCLTCTTGSPGKCLTCETEDYSPFPLYLNGQCLKKCPLGYYPTGFQCKRCDPKCAECADGGATCTKCYTGNYLSGNTCVNKCLSGTEYQNETAQSCQTCLAPCATCSKSTTVCDTCLSVGPQTLFYMN